MEKKLKLKVSKVKDKDLTPFTLFRPMATLLLSMLTIIVAATVINFIFNEYRTSFHFCLFRLV
jgi:uncharacterized membrane protein